VTPTAHDRISVVAYEALPNLVFVRVPNERARYMLTDISVALRGCPHCGARLGEPCYSAPGRYHVDIHILRKVRLHPSHRPAKPRVRLSADDVAAASTLKE